MKDTEIRTTPMHQDYKITLDNQKTGIFYVNTNNGKTVFEDGEQITSIANRLIVFPACKIHAGTTHTDVNYRCVINLNWFQGKLDNVYKCVIMLFGGMPSMGHEFTMGKKDKVESWKTSGSIEATDNQVHIKTNMIVKGRDILQELDEIKHHMLLLPNNLDDII